MWKSLVASLVLTLVSVEIAQARIITFRCTNPDQNTLFFKIDDQLWSLSKNAPESYNIRFNLNRFVYQWSRVQHLSVPVEAGGKATLLKKDAMNSIFIQHSTDSKKASVRATVERQYFEFNCMKSN